MNNIEVLDSQLTYWKQQLGGNLPVLDLPTDGKTYLEIGRFFPSSHLCSETMLPIPKMDLGVRSFLCPYCGQQHDRDINAPINIRNEGLRLLSLGTSDTALGGDVRPPTPPGGSLQVESGGFAEAVWAKVHYRFGCSR